MRKFIFILIFNLQFSICNDILAQSGIIDSTFGVDGISQVGFYNNQPATCRSIIALPNGKIIAAGSVYTGLQTVFGLTSIMNDGSLDLNFGTGGKTTTVINNSGTSKCYSVLSQPDGKIVLGGDYFNGSGYGFVVARYKTDGTLDSTFGTFGITIFEVGNGFIDNTGYAVALQSNGKILLAGTSNNGSNTDFTVVRFKTNGEVDSTFGYQGAAVTPIGTGNDNCYSMAVQNDDKIILAGDVQNGNNYEFTVARYDSDGTLDASFGTGGITTHALGTNDNDFGYSVLVQQPGNKIIIGGSSNHNGSNDFAMLRFDSTGALDNTFGNAGVVLIDYSGNSSDDNARKILLQPDGKILLAGSTNSLGSRFALLRFSSNGVIDNTFGNNGKTSVSILSSQHTCYSAAIDINNKILLGGLVSAANSFIVARFRSGLAVSIDEAGEPLSHNLFVYPNPSSHQFVISSNRGLLSGNKNIELSIEDINGRQVYAENLIDPESITVNVDLPAGIYILKLQDGTKVETQKLVVQ